VIPGEPLGRSVTQTRDADAARQSPLDGSLHEFGREEGERDCHIDFVECCISHAQSTPFWVRARLSPT
jgi:hypothetical protein